MKIGVPRALLIFALASAVWFLPKIGLLIPFFAMLILALVSTLCVFPLRALLIFNLVSTVWIKPDLTLLIKALEVSEPIYPKELPAIFWILYSGKYNSKLLKLTLGLKYLNNSLLNPYFIINFADVKSCFNVTINPRKLEIY